MKKSLLIFIPFILTFFTSCLKNYFGNEKMNFIEGSEVFLDGRTVSIKNIYISEHEVTQGEYEQYCSYGGTFEPTEDVGKGEDFPVYYISWYDAIVYCNKRSLAEGLKPCYTIRGSANPESWGPVPSNNDEIWNKVTCNFDLNGYRLPTEAEWEYAARGGKTSNKEQTVYSGSNVADDVAWHLGNSFSMVHKVKCKEKNELGLYDMSGNLWELCWDWFSKVENTTPQEGSHTGTAKVCRGGSWFLHAPYSSVHYRSSSGPSSRFASLGFRVVRTKS